MPIKIPDTLPAFETLVHEGVRVMTETVAIRQDIRPLQIGLLNLMPNKIKTEVQMARLVGASPLQVELSLVRVGGHRAKNTSEEHLLAFYDTWEEVRHRKFDGFIITGAPIELLDYEDVTYWDEMKQILDWTKTNVHSTLNVCWGAMAAIYHFHGVPKHTLEEKAFGVYRHHNRKPSSVYLNGFSDNFEVPVSRWTEIRIEDIRAVPELDILLDSDETGVCLVREQAGNRLYIFNHVEYDSTSLADEYFRDVSAGVPIKLPKNYFPHNDPSLPPQNRWRGHAHLLFGNWINEIYQTTSYDLEKIGTGA
ncbi:MULTISPECIES: homoserine O-acetyltransferase MetA [unclassified Shinella]|jgi:homoserine O-succinyltransferase|uniref:homoserine O-acetyltransferase MetA n=1 Tax=unclassified Shinella TaxID=2643062 RepID=UPI000437C4F3|nr:MULTISPECIES: homoserine O-succinyltransferase [unclassified Shinella]MCA0341984.1 homoserine O-succinyltransferase [Pseudomonadota bacterium]EYR79642.1 homoserine O-succinyltransferase MetA [Shinella sp. DD12]KNY13881.1 homoserine O-succinyltransferase [Shinella sp. SUS2]KOC72703.1 homoserine O-succinyltransferase [Shinella sp. GWS1]MCO5152390.1 homoserine O-succinyltransferase [Shinella sp.]